MPQTKATRRLYCHPTAAHITDHGNWAAPTPIEGSDRAYLRDLASQVAEAAADVKHEQRRALWTKHNGLARVRPMYAVYPEVGWADLLPESELRIEDPFWRNQEWYLLHLLYRSRFLDDDFVIKPEIISRVDYTIRNGDYGLPSQGEVDRIESTGSFIRRPTLTDYRDLARFTMPEVVVDMKTTDERHGRLTEAFDGILPVKRCLAAAFCANQPGRAATLRGIEQIMLDMYDAPDELHQLMELLTQADIKKFREMEASGLLTPNSENQYVDSGGLGFSDELGDGRAEGGCKLADLWGFGVAQEYSEISPEMHDEFGIKYQVRVLEMFGLNAYGCCEPYTHKFGILRQVPRLRRVSVSPWCDTRIAASELKDQIIFSWKPNPAVILLEPDFQKVKQYVRETLSIARDCVLEVFLKDIISLAGYEQRTRDFCSFMRSEVGGQ